MEPNRKALIIARDGLTPSSHAEQPLPPGREKQAARAHKGRRMDAPWHVCPEAAAAGLWMTPIDLAKLLIEAAQLTLMGKSERVHTQK